VVGACEALARHLRGGPDADLESRHLLICLLKHPLMQMPRGERQDGAPVNPVHSPTAVVRLRSAFWRVCMAAGLDVFLDRAALEGWLPPTRPENVPLVDEATLSRLETYTRYAKALAEEENKRRGDEVGEEAVLDAAALARLYGRSAGAVKKALERWRQAHPEESGRGWLEVQDRRPNSAQYLYRVVTVRPVVEGVSPVPRQSRRKKSRRKSP
jgi:hypothetical protein